MSVENIVIAGASVTGLTAADALRDGGFSGSIIVLSEERELPYDRPPLSKGVADIGQEAQLLRELGHFHASNIDLRLGVSAAGLDIDRRYVVTTNGDALPWDAVIIATGMRPRTIRTVSGETLPALRTQNDLKAVRDGAARHGRVTLVGASFIGLELAASLRSRGVEVSAIGAERLPLAESFGSEIAESIAELHAANGVTLHLGQRVESVDGHEGDYVIRMADGSEHRSPYVITGVGAIPNQEWLVGSGVNLSNGVVTDSHGRTNVPGVFAGGDVAASFHPLLGEITHVDHWTNAMQQGRTVASNILGRDAEHIAVPYFWTSQFGRSYHLYGRRKRGDQVVFVRGGPREPEFLAVFGGGDEFHGVVTLGLEHELRPYRRLLQRGGSWSDALAAGRVPQSL